MFNQSYQFPLLGQLMIFASKFMIQITFVLMFILIFTGTDRERKGLLFALFALPVMVIIIKFIHIFVIEQRPFVQYMFTPLINQAPSLSFPSRHSSIMATIAFSYLWHKSRWTPLFLFIMIWVGISRVFVGVHFPLDVVGGFIVGYLSVFITQQFKKLLKKGLVFN